MEDSVCVVTVTYGDRWDLLNQVLLSLNENNLIKNIIIVNNNSMNDISNLSSHISNRIKVINLEENLGSAYGYHIGIEAAIATDSEYIWLLDDDNKPNNNALENILENWKKISGVEDKIGLLSLRNDRKEYVQAASDIMAKNIFPNKNSFLGFHLPEIPKKLIKKIFLSNKKSNYGVGNKLVEVPYAPYGGFFFHKTLINKIGLPNKEFYLYADDHEFTHRIIKSKGKIYLDPTSCIYDLEHSWYLKDKKPYLISLLLSDEEKRVYYGVRNRVYFEQKDLRNRINVYQCNKWIVIILLLTLSLLFKKKARFKLIMKAINNGENGKLERYFSV
ncbi:glycosyltransferase [Fictibacillus barbaricus]|uniref:Glycosyltransferase n=1 Tax=Fictibacillus barbaricus TaxID=182136 RepID=A0ABS2ZEC1_9BACL|nr:glycosyltransferase [Fictibacillus barbaricus]MBN3546524.1 glycosyltransferase [Fictibacillus barbaricus]GGB41700.1 glycosyl transferase family 2 [Fictibacillus barbaricus]